MKSTDGDLTFWLFHAQKCSAVQTIFSFFYIPETLTGMLLGTIMLIRDKPILWGAGVSSYLHRWGVWRQISSGLCCRHPAAHLAPQQPQNIDQGCWHFCSLFTVELPEPSCVWRQTVWRRRLFNQARGNVRMSKIMPFILNSELQYPVTPLLKP